MTGLTADPHAEVPSGTSEESMTPEEFAEKAAEITLEWLSQFPEEERDRRIAAFERAVNDAAKARKA